MPQMKECPQVTPGGAGAGSPSLTGSRDEILELFWEGWKKYFRPYSRDDAPVFQDLLDELQAVVF